jgi:hypothetical protein
MLDRAGTEGAAALVDANAPKRRPHRLSKQRYYTEMAKFVFWGEGD